jgi:DNA polymerase III subunit epsilon
MYKMFLFLDTETTGLPKKRQDALIEPNVWPDIVSIGFIVTDDAGTIVRSAYSIIKPIDWIIPEDSTRIHKIKHQTAVEHGLSLRKAMEAIRMEILENSCIVAHNIHFDSNTILNAMKWKLNMNTDNLFRNTFCTMEAGREITKIPLNIRGEKYRCPKLSVLYSHLFGQLPEIELHNAMNDAMMCMKIYFKLKSLPIERPVSSNRNEKVSESTTLPLCLAECEE